MSKIDYNKIDFLRGFIELLKDSEIPDDFALWSGISGISGALGRRVWLDWNLFKHYPNLYVFLVAESAVMHKSTTLNAIKPLLQALRPKINIVSEMTSGKEGLIDELMIKERIKDGKLIKDTSACTGMILSSELIVFLNKKTYEAGLGALLTTLFDCDDLFRYKTKSRGSEEIHNACLTMLAATTVHSLKQAIPEDTIHIGLASRVLFIYCSEAGFPQPKPKIDNVLREHLKSKLQRIHSLSGEMNLTQRAEVWYDKVYRKWFHNHPYKNDKNMGGYAGRKMAHLLKLGMIMAVNDDCRLTVDIPHLEAASQFLEQHEVNLGRVITLLTTTEQGIMMERVFQHIKTPTGGITRTKLMRSVSHQMDRFKLNEILEMLEGSGRIRTIVEGRKIMYRSVVKGERRD